MNWRPRVYWALLALLVTAIIALLTRWITHVDRGQYPQVGIAFDESRPFLFDHVRPSIETIEVDRFRVPRVVVVDLGEALFIVTPTTRSITLKGPDHRGIACGYLNHAEQGASAAYWAGKVQDAQLTPIVNEPVADDRVRIRVPDDLRAILARLPTGQGVIRCVFSHPVAAAPTFTERALTLRAENGAKGAVIVDVSALEDIDDLRFSGGIAIPFAGERTRLLDRHDSIVSAEWSNVAAEEQRDIVLVTIGALAAIAAAMAIEAIRPFVEKENHNA